MDMLLTEVFQKLFEVSRSLSILLFSNYYPKLLYYTGTTEHKVAVGMRSRNPVFPFFTWVLKTKGLFKERKCLVI